MCVNLKPCHFILSVFETLVILLTNIWFLAKRPLRIAKAVANYFIVLPRLPIALLLEGQDHIIIMANYNYLSSREEWWT